MFFRRPYALSCLFLRLKPQERLDLAHEIEGRNQRFLARTPLGRADLIRMSINVLSRFNLAEKLRGVAADAAVMDFTGHNLAFGVDHEGAAFGKTGFFDHDAEVAADYARGVTHHREAHFADSRARTVPGHVREVCVRGYGIDFNAALLKLFVVLGEIFEFGRADEREICRIEEDDGPLAWRSASEMLMKSPSLKAVALNGRTSVRRMDIGEFLTKKRDSNWCDLRFVAAHRV